MGGRNMGGVGAGTSCFGWGFIRDAGGAVGRTRLTLADLSESGNSSIYIHLRARLHEGSDEVVYIKYHYNVNACLGSRRGSL